MAPLALQCGMLPGEDVHLLLQMNHQQLLPYGLAAAERPLDETVVARLAGAASAVHAACLALQNPAVHDFAENPHVEIVVFHREGRKPELQHPLWGSSAVEELYCQTETLNENGNAILVKREHTSLFMEEEPPIQLVI